VPPPTPNNLKVSGCDIEPALSTRASSNNKIEGNAYNHQKGENLSRHRYLLHQRTPFDSYTVYRSGNPYGYPSQ